MGKAKELAWWGQRFPVLTLASCKALGVLASYNALPSLKRLEIGSAYHEPVDDDGVRSIFDFPEGTGCLPELDTLSVSRSKMGPPGASVLASAPEGEMEAVVKEFLAGNPKANPIELVRYINAKGFVQYDRASVQKLVDWTPPAEDDSSKTAAWCESSPIEAQ